MKISKTFFSLWCQIDDFCRWSVVLLGQSKNRCNSYRTCMKSHIHSGTRNSNQFQSQNQARLPLTRLWITESFFFCHSTAQFKSSILEEKGKRTFCGSSGSSEGWGHNTKRPSFVNFNLDATSFPNSSRASLKEVLDYTLGSLQYKGVIWWLTQDQGQGDQLAVHESRRYRW